jgi:predicted enzyme related to lactoylglutathione lyase
LPGNNSYCLSVWFWPKTLFKAGETMLNTEKVVAFVSSADTIKARSFYEGVIGLRVISEDRFALVLDANGTMLRVTKVENFKPQQFTILGWDVTDIDESVSDLNQRGIQFENYSMAGQDERGIWKSPSGARVAWFKDPDGNVLSLTQFA